MILLGSSRLTSSSLSCLMFPPSDQTMDPLWLSLTRFWFDSLHCNCDLPNANRICLIFAIKTDHSLFHQVTPCRFSSRRPIWLVLFVITWRCDRSSNSVVCVLSEEIWDGNGLLQGIGWLWKSSQKIEKMSLVLWETLSVVISFCGRRSEVSCAAFCIVG